MRAAIYRVTFDAGVVDLPALRQRVDQIGGLEHVGGGHELEHVRSVSGVAAADDARELLIPLSRLLLDEDREIERVLERQGGEVDTGRRG